MRSGYNRRSKSSPTLFLESFDSKEARAQVAARVCGLLLKKGIHAWSPIVHNHAMMKTFNEFTLEERRTKILDFDFTLLKASKCMIVLKIEGWEQSYGVKAEIDLCNQLAIPIKYLNPDHLESMDPIQALSPVP